MSLKELVLEERDGSEQGYYQKLYWEGNFIEYLNMLEANPRIARSSFQRLYDMVLSYGSETIKEGKDSIVRYKFFQDPRDNEKDAIYGLDKPLMELVETFRGAAEGYGVERRFLLLHGPVGSSKSTIVRLLKKGLEDYSKKEEGALYTFGWVQNDKSVVACPMNEEPLHLVPEEFKKLVESEINKRIEEEGSGQIPLSIEGGLCPYCRFEFKDRVRKYDGDWRKLINEDIRIKRLILSEEDRIGIGTFQPKDEKNQDSTELTGDINYRKIAEYGSDSDPRAFNFDGEFNRANRGLFEIVEVLKLDVAFLYDLLGASQEHVIKPKKFAQVSIDEVLIGHTNEPDYRKIQSNEFMEALKDRTIKIDIPYVTRLSEEIKIYEKSYNPRKVRGKHLAPHTLEMASMWAVLTRLEEPKHAGLTLLQKLKLYDGKVLPGFTRDNVKELMEGAMNEGMEGISPRYVQGKISNALVSLYSEKCINPFMVLNALEEGLKHHPLITSEDKRKKYKELIAIVKGEYEDIVKNEVQRAISTDEEALSKLCGNYVDNLSAYTQKEKVKNKFTGQQEDPDEKLMRSIEEKINIDAARKDDFRTQIMNYIGALALDRKIFNYRSNERLLKALELKLFEDQRDTIKLTSIVSGTVEEETQKKIDVVKSRMIERYNYCDVCATDVLHFVASIFARGDSKSGSKP